MFKERHPGDKEVGEIKSVTTPPRFLCSPTHGYVMTFLLGIANSEKEITIIKKCRIYMCAYSQTRVKTGASLNPIKDIIISNYYSLKMQEEYEILSQT